MMLANAVQPPNDSRRMQRKGYYYSCKSFVSSRTPWDAVQVVHVVLKVLDTMFSGPLASRPRVLAEVSCLVLFVRTPTEDGPKVGIHLVRLVLEEVIRVIRCREAELVVV